MNMMLSKYIGVISLPKMQLRNYGKRNQEFPCIFRNVNAGRIFYIDRGYRRKSITNHLRIYEIQKIFFMPASSLAKVTGSPAGELIRVFARSRR